VRVWLTRITAGWIWPSARRAARLLYSFSRAEASSMLDLLAAANATPSAARRALYLGHALDEERHARVFVARARELDPHQGGAEAAADFDALYERLGELGFLAYVHRGEHRGRRQFEAHREALLRRGDARGAAIFEAILADERRHEAYTHELLVELAGSAPAVSRALRRAALQEALWGWRRAGRGLSGLIFVCLSSLLFLTLAPMALYARLRPSPKGWLTPPEAPR